MLYKLDIVHSTCKWKKFAWYKYDYISFGWLRWGIFISNCRLIAMHCWYSLARFIVNLTNKCHGQNFSTWLMNMEVCLFLLQCVSQCCNLIISLIMFIFDGLLSCAQTYSLKFMMTRISCGIGMQVIPWYIFLLLFIFCLSQLISDHGWALSR